MEYSTVSVVFLAGQCYLAAGGNHSYEDTVTPIMLQASFSKGGSTIGEDVRLGNGVIVMDGASVGKGTTVGAGSVVTRAFPEYGIAVGTPAKKTKDR